MKSLLSGLTHMDAPESQMIVKLSFGSTAVLHATGCCRTTDCDDRQAQLPGQMDGVLEGSVGAVNGSLNSISDGLLVGLFDGVSDGSLVGISDGSLVGSFDGTLLGLLRSSFGGIVLCDLLTLCDLLIAATLGVLDGSVDCTWLVLNASE